MVLQPKRWEDEMIQDIRFGIRMLIKNPGFSVTVMLTLALGIGVCTALFSAYNALVLKPLPFKEAESVVAFASRFSFADYQDLAARTQTLAGLTVVSEAGPTLSFEYKSAGQTQREGFGVMSCQLVAANYFSLLGAEMAVGRGFLPEEVRTPMTHPVVVLSHYFWERAFHSNPQIIGQPLRVAGQPFIIIGVTAREFVGTAPNRPACWLPLMMRDALEPAASIAPEQSWLANRDRADFNLWGRLKPGVTAAQAQAELTSLIAQIESEHPRENRKAAVKLQRAPGLVPVDEAGEAAQVFLILPLSVLLVLLIACANVANLMLARAARRQKEVSTRLALGATRGRIVRQLLTESVLIAAAGGALGLLLAWWALKILYPLFLSHLTLPVPFIDSLAINLEPDYRVFGFTLLMAVLAGVAAGLAPAWQASRPNLTTALKGEGSIFGEHLSQSRLRNGLIVVQLAFSLMLLVSAGLLVRNLQKLQTIDTGFETERLFAVEVDLGAARARETETLRQQLAARLSSRPDVQSVSRTSRAPLSGVAGDGLVALPGQTDAKNLLEARYDIVSANHLATLGLPLLHGRNFTEQEATSGARVVIISAAMVRRLWPHFNDPRQALGLTIATQAGQTDVTEEDATTPARFPVYEIIGIARDAVSGVIFQPDRAHLYLPFKPGGQGGEYLLVRTRTEARRVMATLQGEVTALNPHATLDAKTTTEWLTLQNAPFRIGATLALALGLAALALAAIGLYGVMSFLVAQRTREVGIRVALGAEAHSILALFLKQGMRLVSVGLALGLLGGANSLLTAEAYGCTCSTR
jgi:predicted permease